MTQHVDAVVIGSGPNGLAAAIRLAQAGLGVTILEANSTPGGAVQSAELTLPGFVHDPFAAVFPIAVSSPFLMSLPLQEHGLSWAHPPVPLAHPLDDGSAVLLHRSIEATASELGSDNSSYRALMFPLAESHHDLIAALLAPPRSVRHAKALARFGALATRSAAGFAASHFHEDRSRALLAGNAAHAILPLEEPLTAGFGLFLGLLGHVSGWPIAGGGAARLSAALVSVARSLGVTIELDCRVRSMQDVPKARAVVFDIGLNQIAEIGKSELPAFFRRQLSSHRFGPGVFKVDYALDSPVPWTAERCSLAGTIHVGGNLEEIARGERDVAQGRHTARPFVIASQPSLFDSTRAPDGKHTLWAYCHVPPGSSFDMTDRIEQQIERFAPGFRERILARHAMGPRELEARNPNLVGGAINGGRQDIETYLAWTLAWPSPYATPNPSLFRCSAATPPGGGVHGMAGFHAAEYVLRKRFGQK